MFTLLGLQALRPHLLEASGIIFFSSSTGLCCTTLTNAE